MSAVSLFSSWMLLLPCDLSYESCDCVTSVIKSCDSPTASQWLYTAAQHPVSIFSFRSSLSLVVPMVARCENMTILPWYIWLQIHNSQDRDVDMNHVSHRCFVSFLWSPWSQCSDGHTICSWHNTIRRHNQWEIFPKHILRTRKEQEITKKQ